MNSTSLAWTIALFFGCSIAFAAIRRWTDDYGAGVTLIAQLVFLAVVIVALVWYVKRSDDSDSDSGE